MEDSKYYTPSIDEFFVGFQYEQLEAMDTAYEEEPSLYWNKYIWNQESAGEHALYNTIYEIEDDTIRVKLIDKSDIESCGFTTEFKDTDYPILYTNNNYRLLHYYNDNLLLIDNSKKRLFEGIVKNISELRKLLKQIGIND